jgi:signal transduction histidine kinase
MTRARIRNVAAITIAAVAVLITVPAALTPRAPFTGITLRLDGTAVVVDTVAPTSRAFGEIQPGTIVQDVNFISVKNIPDKELGQFLLGDFSQLGVLDAAGETTEWTFPPEVALPSTVVSLVGIGLLFGIAIWVGRGLAGESLRALAIPLAAASATPLILLPAWSPLTWPTAITATALPLLALLVLTDGFISRIAIRIDRYLAVAIAMAAGIISFAVSIVVLARERSSYPAALPSDITVGFPISLVMTPGVALVLALTVTVVPAAILVYGGNRHGGRTPTIGGSSEELPLLLAAITPIAITTSYGSGQLGVGLTPSLIWLLVVVVVLQGNVRFEILRLQRDTVVAATEAERARLAADLHDDALQEMTVLVRRLDQAGDARAAELARSIADRLREVCGDLRLPILDELGAGPALEWLVERVGETSGRSVGLERADAARPPAEVELAVFRVAQEALANAVTHGAPPIKVRYEAGPGRAVLVITDHGAGLPADAASIAGRSGHYGLLNMRQRAEQIGARIDFRRQPEGGTVVGLVWGSA